MWVNNTDQKYYASFPSGNTLTTGPLLVAHAHYLRFDWLYDVKIWSFEKQYQ